MTFQNLKEATDYLEQKRQFRGIDLGLARMRQACAQLGQPERGQAIVHFAGSNGKGSTLHYSQEILLAQGFSVASFTSPANETILDQICFNREPITASMFVAILNQICLQLGKKNSLTEFEILTLIAFLFFQKKLPDFVLLETGMGGRLDATNVVEPLASVITTISMEHTQFLGHTLEEIAAEKAGIIKEKKPVFVGKVQPSAKSVILAQAQKMKAVTHFFEDDFSIELVETDKPGEIFNLQLEDGTTWKHLKISMSGQHQVENATLAATLCHWLGAEEVAIRKGLMASRWHGRFEVVAEQPLILLDGAHNPAGIKVLCETIQRKFPNAKWRILFSVFKDKNYKEMLEQLDAIATQMVFTEINHERTANIEQLLTASHCPVKQAILDHRQAFATISANLADREHVLITGSLELVKQIRKIVEEK